jgi:hypothetical protein
MRTNCGVASVQEHDTRSFTISPNPVSGQLTIQTTAVAGSPIKIFAVNGKYMMDTKISNNETIDVSHLENGIYTIVMETSNHLSAQKLVILH